MDNCVTKNKKASEMEPALSAEQEGPKKIPKRVRRSAEDAKRQILEAAENRLSRYGPEGVRLKEIAKDVGVSHPTILHHFESREGLVAALIERTTERFQTAVKENLEASDAREFDIPRIISLVFEEMDKHYSGRLWAWVELTESNASVVKPNQMLEFLTDQLVQLRIKHDRENGLPTAPASDTRFLIMLVVYAAFADAVIGGNLTRGMGMDEEERSRFGAWLGQMCDDRVRRPQ